MLFWIFVITLVVGIVCVILDKILWEHTNYSSEAFHIAGWILIVASIIAIVISLIIIIGWNVGLDAKIEQNHQIYESLTYQLENDLYNNDNDFGKKELYNQIQDWNADLAYYKRAQDDFWIGIYIPDIFDQFEFIELSHG